MSSQRVHFEPSIVAVCSWVRANYEYHNSNTISRDLIWKYFLTEHKRKGFSVNDSQFNEFLGYVGEYIVKSASMRNVIVDKSNKRYVNLRQKRSGPPEEVSACTYIIMFIHKP